MSKYLHKFCANCGVQHTDMVGPHQICQNGCGQTTWHNPKPIGVLLQPVSRGTYGLPDGILLGRRGGDVAHGEWGLIGGFSELADEGFEHTMAREFFEEIELHVEFDIQLMHSFANAGEGQVLVFGLNRIAMSQDSLEAFVPNEETLEIRVAWRPEKLCFDSHTDALARHFKGMNFRD